MISHVIWDLGETINTLPPEGMDLKPLDQYKEIELRPGVQETLNTIEQLGYTQAVLSNTASSDSATTIRMMENLGINKYFTYVYATQSELDHQKPEKPNRAVFDIVLNALKIEARQAVMVGNTWDTDIIGANLCGMHAIWLQNPIVLSRKDKGTKVQSPPWIIPVWDVSDVPMALTLLSSCERQLESTQN
ncbi:MULTISPECIES: HAD family hydrolase [unclassified Peribacillus]|uniref:HAD family hydrolase n=1 Tax=unclassified Peribacillus TaxID=2675266 RepID=UPI001F4E3FD0|nr:MULTISPECIES: HAD family hydrolase [unclassified Peribacillus]MCK1986045.1 HAD family hydrolase [Peribacillus sp. Aquil_B1]MCK2011343.1 HAD family hydrolase [Peribacillus sp. Aquil_B8]